MTHIKQFREAEGLTQEQLATLLNVSTSTIGSYEVNYRNPQITTLVLLADRYNTTVDYLIGLTDDPRHPGEEGEYLTPDEKEILDLYRALPEDKKLALIRLMQPDDNSAP